MTDFSQLKIAAAQMRDTSGEAAVRGRVLVSRSIAAIERDAKILAPVDTGNLRNSITSEVSDGGLTGEAGPTAEYGLYVEDGTSRMAPQPYMGPAFERHAPAFEVGAGQLGADIF